jgi:hypothetical protein
VSGIARPLCARRLCPNLISETRYQGAHFVSVNAWGIGPRVESRTPELAWGSRVARDNVHVQMRDLIPEDEQVNVFSAYSRSKHASHSTTDQTQGRSFGVVEITHFGYVSFGLNNQPAAVRFRRFQRVYMTDIDQVIFERDSTLSMLTKAVLLTHEAPRRPRIGHEPHSLTRMGRQGRFKE